MNQPDPNASPTVASFAGPPLPAGPPVVSAEALQQAATAAQTMAGTVAGVAATPTLDPLKQLDMLQKLTSVADQLRQRGAVPQAPQAPPQGNDYRPPQGNDFRPPQGPPQAPRGPQSQPSPSDRIKAFQQDGNAYGLRIAGFLNTHLPGVHFGMTFEIAEDGALHGIRVAAYLLDEAGEPQVIGDVEADVDAMGQAIVAVAQKARAYLDSLDAAATVTAY